MFSTHFIHSLGMIGLLFFALADGYSVSIRLGATLICLSLLLMGVFTKASSPNADSDSDSNPITQPLIFRFSDQNTHWFYALSALFFLIAALVVTLLLPRTGLQLRWNDSEETERVFSYSPPQFELEPAILNPQVLQKQPGKATLSGWFDIDEPIHAILLYSSHGESRWKLNGEEIGTITADSLSRNLFWYQDIQPGVHHLQCEVEGYAILPTLSVRVGMGKRDELLPLPGPFLLGLDRGGFYGYSIKKHLQILLLALAILFAVPLLNRLSIPLVDGFIQYSGMFFALLWIALLGFLGWWIHHSLHSTDFLQMEADESAFGLMGQLFLQGQSPPLFHYGQNYQGTLETFLLAGFQSLGLSTAQALKCLPGFWFLLFLTITCAGFWRFGSKWMGLFSTLAFVFMGTHFHWIFHKAWYGYAFGMVCCAGMGYAVLHTSRYGLRPGAALLWSVCAGLSLYELPVTVSFVAATFGWIVCHQYYGLSDYNSLLRIVRRVGFNKAMLVLYAGLFIALSPYLLSLQLEQDSGSVSFLLQGRKQAPPREAGEHPFFDRFLEECFPVLAGTRLPFHSYMEPAGGFLPSFPVMILSLGFLSFPFLRKPLYGQGWVFSQNVAVCFVFLLPILVILVGCYSSMGIWPWYFIALYWAVPVFLYGLFVVGIRAAPGLTLGTAVVYLLVQAHSLTFLDYRSFQPSSLAAAGLHVPSDFSEIRDFLHEKDIRFVIADQGYDYSAGNSGKDWLGEVLSYDSAFQVISFDSQSRRLPDQANLLMGATRVAYLFHQDYLYHNPLPGDVNHAGIQLKNLDLLFGEAFLQYDRHDFHPYILYTPKPIHRFNKIRIQVNASYPYFINPLMDNNLGIRSESANAYWSSDKIPPQGVQLKFLLDLPATLNRLVLFHGTKGKDYPRSSEVTCIDKDGNEFVSGEFRFDPNAHASKIDFENMEEIVAVKVRVFPNEEQFWLTICEAWLW